jgi:hypothetical protein
MSEMNKSDNWIETMAQFAQEDAELEEAALLWMKLDNPREILNDE